jgi:hypothetical protein
MTPLPIVNLGMDFAVSNNNVFVDGCHEYYCKFGGNVPEYSRQIAGANLICFEIYTKQSAAKEIQSLWDYLPV